MVLYEDRIEYEEINEFRMHYRRLEIVANGGYNADRKIVCVFLRGEVGGLA